MPDLPATRPEGAEPEERDGFERPLPKRFYISTTVEQIGNAFEPRLDGRPIRTPGKRPLHVPSRALADAIAAEWEAQDKVIRHETMLQTKLANTAIDRVADREGDIVDEIVSFMDTDAILYRAEHPDTLVASQSKSWDPLLAWANSELDIKLTTIVGVLYKAQPAESLDNARGHIAALDPFALTALHNMTTLTGSALTALAIYKGYLTPIDAWQIVHIDEDHQIEEWGRDEEAAERRALQWTEFEASHRFLILAGTDPQPKS